MKVKVRQEAISFYNDEGVLIASYNQFYNCIYGGCKLHQNELDEIHKVLNKRKCKAYTFFSMNEILEDEGEIIVEEEIGEVEKKTKKTRKKKAEKDK